jgi:serine/threonine protein kinase
MGRVYLCSSRGGRMVAIKVIRPELADDPQFRVRFRRELAAVSRVQSHVTAGVVDADAEADMPWLATVYLQGPTLAEAVNQRSLSSDELRSLAAALAEALQVIHEAGLVHRDLKPSNIILTQDGPKVIDFGISHAAEDTVLTSIGVRVGSPGFMSPEQVRGHVVGWQTDVFALGAVLAFAATGRAPFGTGHTDAVLYRVLHEPPDVTGVPTGLRPLIDACMAKDPDRRPTCREVLDKTGDSLGPSVASVGSSTDAATEIVTIAATAELRDGDGRGNSSARRRRARVLAASALAAAVVGGTGAGFVYLLPHTPATPAARPVSATTPAVNPSVSSPAQGTPSPTPARTASDATPTVIVRPDPPPPVPAVTRAAVARALRGRCAGGASVRIDTMLEFDYTGDRVNDAVAQVECVAGAGSAPSELLAFAATGNGPRLTQELITVNADFLIEKVWRIKTRVVVVRGWTYSSKDLPRCCPDQKWEIGFEPSGGRFIDYGEPQQLEGVVK